MEVYANVLLWVVPIFIVLILIEIIYGQIKKKQTHSFMDTLSSLSSGMTNILKDTLGLVVVIISYPYLLGKLSIFNIENTFIVYIAAFICVDFSGYWSHRLNHKINLFWNQHIIHHSSEEFNLACALRQSFSDLLGYTALFLIPAAVLGVPTDVITLLAPLHLFGQFWYHTQHIGKLGILEYFLVTPSQHRVHHAINPIYIDKNLAPIFCVWDRCFGTFQEEMEDEPPVYGVLKPVRTWNPLLINFQHLWGLIFDAWHTRSIREKLTLWWQPTGYRPEDVKKRFPRNIITSINEVEKYNPESGNSIKGWAMFQWLGTTFMLLLFLANYPSFENLQALLFGGVIMLSIFGYTSVMDQQSWAFNFELVRNLIGLLFFIIPSQNVFYLSTMPWLFYFGLAYFSLSLLSCSIIDKRLKIKLVNEG
jgi:sterol desaturase/sphingolipid hydroxylase (fatty acid hydroxylase superfamily)